MGDAWTAPPPELGKPLGKFEVGARTRYRWPELEVTVNNGRVEQIRRLDAASLAAETEERARVAAAERAALLAERKERTRMEAARVEQEKQAAIAAREQVTAPARPTKELSRLT
ncbi:MAG: hypothetical protein H7067_13170 [Burkholderiales bacterium]|nr:hypothetical protein [Opitutaceae bacterium]